MSKLSDLFEVYSGSKLDFGKQTIDEQDGLNFISRNSNNNGVVGKVELQPNMKVYKKGDITVPLGGSYLLSAFVQDEDFVTAQNVAVLRPKYQMSDLEKWFYCYSLRENRFKFSAFGREVNKYLKDIELPKNIPNWVSNARLDIPLEIKENSLIEPKIDLDTDSWRYFQLNELFVFEGCKCKNASLLLEDGEDIEYIGAKKKNGGVVSRVKMNEELVTKGNCVIFICDGQGSVGYTNYIDHDFIGSTTLSVGRNPNLDIYIGLFLVTVLDTERYRYSFGRKYKTNLTKAKIKLPALINEHNKKYEPNWEYMRDYIKALNFGTILS